MSKSPNTVIQDPRTPSNLKRLTKISIRCDVSSVGFLDVEAVKLKRAVTELIQDEGLICDNRSKSRLIIGIAAETRDAGKNVIYAVEVALREAVPIPRTVSPPQIGDVDTWRHQSITGIQFKPYNDEHLKKLLVGEALRQVGVFLEDWSGVNDVSPRPTEADDEALAAAKLPPIAPDWYGRARRVEDALKGLLERLAYDPPSTATLDRFEPSGTKVNFAATVTNVPRAVAAGIGGAALPVPVVTRITSSFDMADASTVAALTLTAALPPGLDSPSLSVSLAPLAALFAV